MFGPRINKVFASRSNALWWSAMVLVTAYCVAAEPPAEMGPESPNSQVSEQSSDVEGDPWADMKNVAKKRDKMLP